MSGGVDSSAAAALLIEQGYNVIGLFMHNWEEEDADGACTAESDFADAKAVCAALKIPCYSVNFAKEYMANVFEHFLSEYKAGRTPNPDVLCNREVKFKAFADYACKMGADFIAKGHYCRLNNSIDKDNDGIDTNKKGCAAAEENIQLLKSKDSEKDQTYFLNQVATRQLSGVLFPVGGLNKGEVRAIAQKYNLPTAAKKDSTGICFIGERKFREFLSKYLPAQRGEIRDINGRLLGTHNGIMYYTLGQRRGLDIGGIKGEANARWFVVDKCVASNTLILSCGEGEELFSDGLITDGFNWIGAIPKEEKFECFAKFRYRQDEQAVVVTKSGGVGGDLSKNSVRIDFKFPQRAVTPGQYAVLYLGDRCLGGGVIKSSYKL